LPAIVESGKPAVVGALGDQSPLPEEFYATFRQHGVAVFRSIERAMRALALATTYGRALRGAEETAPLPNATAPLPQRGVLPEYLGKTYLAALGIPVPPGKLARDLAGAKVIAAEIGYPVALKAQASALTHKSDAGGVILNIGDERALAASWDTMQTSMTRPAVTLDGILVERMAKPGLEMIVGAKRDPNWGPVVMVGLGGIWVEALGDVRLMPADLPRARVIEEVQKLKGAPLLRGLRGNPPADVEALADAVMRIGAAIRAEPNILEIDINPIVVHAEGAVALDALIVGR